MAHIGIGQWTIKEVTLAVKCMLNPDKGVKGVASALEGGQNIWDVQAGGYMPKGGPEYFSIGIEGTGLHKQTSLSW